MRLTAWATIAAFSGLLFASPALSQSALKGGPTPSPPGAKVEFIDLKDGAVIGPKTTIHFGLHGMGVAPAGTKKAQFRSSPSADRHGSAASRPADPERREPSPLRRRPDGNGTLAIARTAHAATPAWRRGSHPPHSAGLFRQDSRDGGGTPPAPAQTAQASPPGTRHPSPPGARVYIVSPENGSYVPTTFTVRFGLEKMGVAPAGVDKPNSGHHHLLIDTPLPPFDQPIPNDENHLHFGAGQTEATVTLPRGRHTLQLLLGDASHIPHDPPVYSECGGCLCRHVAAKTSGPASSALLLPRAGLKGHARAASREMAAAAAWLVRVRQLEEPTPDRRGVT